MAGEVEIRYRVKKVTIGRKMCSSCNGTGKKEVKTAGGMWKTQPCVWCVNGVAKIEHITEIDLIDALKELGLSMAGIDI